MWQPEIAVPGCRCNRIALGRRRGRRSRTHTSKSVIFSSMSDQVKIGQKLETRTASTGHGWGGGGQGISPRRNEGRRRRINLPVGRRGRRRGGGSGGRARRRSRRRSGSCRSCAPPGARRTSRRTPPTAGRAATAGRRERPATASKVTDDDDDDRAAGWHHRHGQGCVLRPQCGSNGWDHGIDRGMRA